jgi:hypothetical protein
MKAAENGSGFDGSNNQNSPVDRAVLVQSPMGPHDIVVTRILAKHPAQVSLSEHDQVVDAFPADRADQSLSVSVLPW